jgi:hypothetical protein
MSAGAPSNSPPLSPHRRGPTLMSRERNPAESRRAISGPSCAASDARSRRVPTGHQISSSATRKSKRSRSRNTAAGWTSAASPAGRWATGTRSRRRPLIWCHSTICQAISPTTTGFSCVKFPHCLHWSGCRSSGDARAELRPLPCANRWSAATKATGAFFRLPADAVLAICWAT